MTETTTRAANGKAVIPPKAEKKAQTKPKKAAKKPTRKDPKAILEEANHALLKEMHGDRVTKADLEAALSAEGLEQALDIIEEGDPREVRRLSRKIRRAGRLDANPLLALVYWLEEVTSNWLPASAKTVGYAYLLYKAGKLSARGFKAVLKMFQGDYVGSAADAAGAFDELRS
jgi:hypothetical protein